MLTSRLGIVHPESQTGEGCSDCKLYEPSLGESLLRFIVRHSQASSLVCSARRSLLRPCSMSVDGGFSTEVSRTSGMPGRRRDGTREGVLHIRMRMLPYLSALLIKASRRSCCGYDGARCAEAGPAVRRVLKVVVVAG